MAKPYVLTVTNASLSCPVSEPIHGTSAAFGENTEGTLSSSTRRASADHTLGKKEDIKNGFSRLMAWGRKHFPGVKEPEFRWSGQVMESVDGLAFIGRNPGDNPTCRSLQAIWEQGLLMARSRVCCSEI
jgi:hypothetical protein